MFLFISLYFSILFSHFSLNSISLNSFKIPLISLFLISDNIVIFFPCFIQHNTIHAQSLRPTVQASISILHITAIFYFYIYIHGCDEHLSTVQFFPVSAKSEKRTGSDRSKLLSRKPEDIFPIHIARFRKLF